MAEKATFEIHIAGEPVPIKKKAGYGPLGSQRRAFYDKGVTVKDPENGLEDWYPPHTIRKIRTWGV